MNALHSFERDSLERPHDAEATERSALIRVQFNAFVFTFCKIELGYLQFYFLRTQLL